ncbi:hypothetical protein [Ehrlichia canis]|uniref:hypothetical protein n=1 Tax=Ehrlichia canis TaxID=944 RepID=UPI00003A8446|nr:hypothetical protein [Ehrlichia canis]UKC53885.1 hypothetical protein s20019040002_000930 [Ehrlichia canis]UKC54821.1 hypothetical protein s20026770001_000929 [Ehrlichia canis]UKC55757.1 hypothetical protein s21009500007_000929 [Ehrlichia canis]
MPIQEDTTHPEDLPNPMLTLLHHHQNDGSNQESSRNSTGFRLHGVFDKQPISKQ